MKLPIFQPAHTALPTRSAQGAPSAPPVDPTGAGLAQIGSDLMQAGARFGAIAAREARAQEAEDARAERLRAAAEKAKQAHLDDIAATGALNVYRDDLDVAARDLELGVRDPETDAILTRPAGPQEYMGEWEKRAQVARNRLLSQPLSPGADQRVRTAAEKIFGERRHEARTASDKRAVDTYGALFEHHVEDYERRIATEPNPERATELEQEMRGVFERAQGMKSLTSLQTRWRQSEERIDTTKARLQADQDPAGVIDALRGPADKSPFRLAPDKAVALAKTLEGEWSARQQRETAQAQHDEKAMADSIVHNRDATIGALAREASNGRLTLEQLDQWQEIRNIPLGPYENIRKIITEGPKDAPSNKDLYTRLSIAVNTGDPTVTRSTLTQFRAPGGGLNQKDYEHLDAKLKGEIDARRAEGDRQTTKARLAEDRADRLQRRDLADQDRADSKARQQVSDQYKAYHDGLSYARTQLRFPDDFRMDHNDRQRWADFANEFNARVHPSNSRAEGAGAVLDEMIPRFRKSLGQDADRSFEELDRNTRWKSEEELAAATKQWNLTPEAVKQQKGLIGQYKAAKDKRDQYQRDQAEAKAMGKKPTPGGTNRPPIAND